jgi:hypothetical protein
MKISAFAERYRLKLRREPGRDPGDSTQIIAGRLGHIYEYDTVVFGVMFIPSGAIRPRLWHSSREKGLAAGMTLLQDGDWEGTLLFDPHDGNQAKLAIKIAGIQPSRNSSAAELMNLAKGHQFQSCFNTTVEASSDLQNVPGGPGRGFGIPEHTAHAF